MSFQGQLNCVPNISGDQRRGWAMVYLRTLETYEQEITMARWGIDGEIRNVKLPLTRRISPSSGNQAMAGARLILGAGMSYSSPAYFYELDFETGEVLHETQIGDKVVNIVPIQLANGGVAGICMQNSNVPGSTVTPPVRFTAYYRAPLTGSPHWWSRTYEFSVLTGFGQAYSVSGVEASDGTIWVFFTHDSARTIGLIRFRIKGFELELIEFNHLFIPLTRGLPIEPSGEFPSIFAAADTRNKRIILTYRNGLPGNTECQPTGYHISYRVAITEVKEDKSMRVLSVPGLWSWQGGHYMAAVWPRREGIYYLFDYIGVGSGCGLGYKLGRFVDGAFQMATDWPGFDLMAVSKDGWILAYNSGTATSDLIRLVFVPEISIRDLGQNVEIDWEPGLPSDVLLENANYGGWRSIWIGVPPVILPNNKQIGAWNFQVVPTQDAI